MRRLAFISAGAILGVFIGGSVAPIGMREPSDASLFIGLLFGALIGFGADWALRPGPIP